jgi:glutamine amidotransferase
MGNLGSISNLLSKIGVKSIITSEIEIVKNSNKIILPGVGSYDNAVKKLSDLDLFNTIIDLAKNENVNILGICLGMQLLGTRSEEGSAYGLNLIPGLVKKFEANKNIKVPHMGWNQVTFKQSKLFEGLDENRFYFVHSYYFDCMDESNVFGKTKYGDEFTSFICNGNVMGVQFHPEKSHKFGMKLLQNFSKL